MFPMIDLRAALKAKGKRQRDLAVACNVSASAVCRWVKWVGTNGVHGVPIPAAQLPIVARVAGVKIEALLPKQQQAA